MSEKTLPDRLYASLPSDDPRFTELRQVIAAVIQPGKGSPAARMLGEWALLGYLLTTGKLAGDRFSVGASFPADLPDPEAVLSMTQQVEAAAQAWDFE
ncbi:MAG TPA: hypothetical protein VGD58_28245 [Herpetosiphonaceae bacterium]